MEKQIYKISYILKNENGFLVDYKKKFKSFSEMCDFIKKLKISGNLIGKPVIGE